jgi:PDZ domain-containing protein
VSVAGRREPKAERGGIYFVNVLVRKASLLEEAFPGLHDGADLVPAEQLNPAGVSETERRRASRREMSLSQQVASVVALRELGYRPRVEAGVLVTGVVPGRPAQGKLRTGDVVVAVDGGSVRTPGDLRRRIARSRGRSVRMTVRRRGERRQVTVRPVRDVEQQALVVGIRVGQSLDVDLPVRIRIETGDVGGPSAGLAFALTLLEEFGRDVDRGRRVVVTGALDLDGTVLPVGGIEQKVIGAKRSDADIFVVPAGDNAREARQHAGGLRILPVNNFLQALRALATSTKNPA